jgi:PAS domain S-box-containing protein
VRVPGSTRGPMSARLGITQAGTDLLVEAGAVLASSLDLTETMTQVARLIVPQLGDLCVIDMLDDDGAIREVAVAAADETVARALEDLRARFPVDPGSEHPVARVIHSGEPLLLPEMTSALLRSFAQGSEHAAFMIEHDYRSAIVAPLSARGRTRGAVSVLRLGDGAPYGEEDLALVLELARRAAPAIDNARLFADLRRVEQRLAAVLESVAEAITTYDASGRRVFANQAAADLFGVETPEQLTSAEPAELWQHYELLDEGGAELFFEDMPGPRMLAGESPEPLLMRTIERSSGVERWLMLRASAVLSPVSGRLEYVVNVFEDITGVKRAELAETFMAEASRELVSSTDYATTLTRVARLAVPQIADWCAIHVLADDGRIERVALHHVNHDKQLLLEQLDDSYPPSMQDPAGVGEVLRSGTARLYQEIDLDSLRTFARDEEHLRQLQSLGAMTVIVVPMIGGERAAIGTITLASSETARRLTKADMGLAVRLGRRSGTAVERARIYTERARIAHLLQRALLPESLPVIPGCEVRSLYSAAGALNEVGGDFYDVFDYDDRWMLLVGDVVGKGARAAGATALARHTLRAAALSGQSITEMLETLHRALRRQPQGADLCTVCLVAMTLTGPRAELTVALAGHEHPLLIDAGGAVSQLGAAGTLLGMIDPIEVHETPAELHPGQTLLLFSDGVSEAGRPDRLLGAAGLRELCRASAGQPLQELLETIEHAALERAGGQLRDDVALLGLRLTGG